MTDDTSFPTAIVPARPFASVRERFDTLARRLGDPMARLFLLQNAPDQEMQFRAAAELMPYRYPKLKVSDVNHTGAVPGGTLNIQINISPPNREEVVSLVIPSTDPLD